MCGLGFHGEPVAWEQMNRQRLEGTMYGALWDPEEQRGRGFLKLSYGGKGKSHKQERNFYGVP